jgi:hypothetical protein
LLGIVLICRFTEGSTIEYDHRVGREHHFSGITLDSICLELGKAKDGLCGRLVDQNRFDHVGCTYFQGEARSSEEECPTW